MRLDRTAAGRAAVGTRIESPTAEAARLWPSSARGPAQIMLGSWLRHFGTRQALAAHAVLAVAVWAQLPFSLPFMVEQHKTDVGAAGPFGPGLGLLATLQIALGIVAFIYLLPFDGTPRTVSFYQAVMRTAHQTSGALLLAATVVLNLRCFRHVAGEVVFCPAGEACGAVSAMPSRLALERGAMA